MVTSAVVNATSNMVLDGMPILIHDFTPGGTAEFSDKVRKAVKSARSRHSRKHSGIEPTSFVAKIYEKDDGKVKVVVACQ